MRPVAGWVVDGEIFKHHRSHVNSAPAAGAPANGADRYRGVALTLLSPHGVHAWTVTSQ